MTLDYEIYKEGGILNNRYQKIEDISEGSYGYVSLAKDVREKRLVAVKYIFKLEDDGQYDGPQDDENDCDSSDCDDDEDTKVDTDRSKILFSHSAGKLARKPNYKAILSE